MGVVDLFGRLLLGPQLEEAEGVLGAKEAGHHGHHGADGGAEVGWKIRRGKFLTFLGKF